MDEATVFEFLRTTFAAVFGRADIQLHPNLSAADVVGWDSFRHVEIILALEAEYGIRIRAREANAAANLGDLVALVVRKCHAPT